MIVAWDDYLDPPNKTAAYRECFRRCHSTFERQRACIDRLLEARRPAVVACLGSGILNDIPYGRLVEANATVHLVDWLPGIVEFGVAHSIIRTTPQGLTQCAYCRYTPTNAPEYCLSYREARAPRRGAHEVCEAFMPHPHEPGTCLAFRKGRLPHVHRQDISGGYASAFGAGLAEELRGVTTWRQAFKRATALAQRLRGHRSALDIADQSVDLIISSMVLSQFEHEPYDYFATQVAGLLGEPSAHEKANLRPAMEKLRSTLLFNQIEGHCAEIARMLAPNGRCFLAFELFHRAAGDRQWHMASEMHGALQQIARHFAFDFDGIPEPIVDTRFEALSGRSAVYHFLLTPTQA